MKNIIQNISNTKSELTQIIGIPFIIRVNKGRNRIETIIGEVENIYPSIFTIKLASGDISTFSYADIYSKNILFVKKQIL